MGISGFTKNEVGKFCMLAVFMVVVKYLMVAALIALFPFLAYYFILGASAVLGSEEPP